jgi:hypothetical protein
MRSSNRFRRFLSANEAWLGIALPAAYAIIFTIYFAILTAGITKYNARSIPVRVAEVGWFNTFLVAGIALVGLQIYTAISRQSRAKESSKERGRREAELLLGVVVSLLELSHPRVTYRALVTIIDSTGENRSCICGANIRTDPEFSLTVPTKFGAAGIAIATRSAQTSNITDSNRNRDSFGTSANGIWPEVACVLAFPLISDNGLPFGTLNFDSNADLSRSGLGNRRVQVILANVADKISEMLKSYAAEAGKAEV